jgi:glycosyltransferase involved in cell wall biosynthesis
MREITRINPSYSATRTVTRQQPVIEKQTEGKFETVLFLPEGEARQGEGGLRTQGYFKTSLEGKPLITVVTVVFNGEKFLEETILNIINQSYDNMEYIIVDGGSDDGTVEIIRQYEDSIDYWVSEKDKGIYDAMNKGLSSASGDWINFMNAGDEFYNNKTLSNIFLNQISKDIIFGQAYIYYKDLSFIRYSDFNLENKDWYLTKLPNHQSVLVSRKIYKEIFYNTDYKYSADSVYMKKIFSEFSCHEINAIISKFELGGVSNFYGTFDTYKQVTVDHIKMSRSVIKPIIVNSIKFLFQKIMGIDNYLKFYIKYIVKK